MDEIEQCSAALIYPAVHDLKRDAAAMSAELCDGNQPFARERNLFLQTEGPLGLAAEGDTSFRNEVALHQPGEGIGHSIVKRLCELLDVSLEIASSPEAGTTLRVVFPRS